LQEEGEFDFVGGLALFSEGLPEFLGGEEEVGLEAQGVSLWVGEHDLLLEMRGGIEGLDRLSVQAARQTPEKLRLLTELMREGGARHFAQIPERAQAKAH
jgi:hypothetical protein